MKNEPRNVFMKVGIGNGNKINNITEIEMFLIFRLHSCKTSLTAAIRKREEVTFKTDPSWLFYPNRSFCHHVEGIIIIIL